MTASGYDGGSAGSKDAEAVAPSMKEQSAASAVAHKAKVEVILVVCGNRL